jgi:hypothetical protein
VPFKDPRFVDSIIWHWIRESLERIKDVMELIFSFIRPQNEIARRTTKSPTFDRIPIDLADGLGKIKQIKLSFRNVSIRIRKFPPDTQISIII